MNVGRRRQDRDRDPGGPDLPRDEAARRPARRTAAPAQLARGRLRRVRADGRDRHRRGHPRGGRRRDRGRDRSARRDRSPARRRRLVRPRPRRAGRPRGRGHRSAGRHRRLQLDRRLRLLRARAACRSAATRITADGYEIRVESVRENRIVAVRIHPVTTDRQRPLNPTAPRLTSVGASSFPLCRRSALAKGADMWVVKLTDKQIEVMRSLLRSETHLGPSLLGRARGARARALGRASGRAAAVGGRLAAAARRGSPRPTSSGTFRVTAAPPV